MRTAPPRALPVLGLALALVAWLAYWSARIRGAEDGLALFVAVTLVAMLANVAQPVPWVRPWTRGAALGAIALVGAGLVLATGLVLRAEGFDPPMMEPEQVLPAAWLLAASLLLVGAWRLLGPSLEGSTGPACASCASPVSGPRCARCGAALEL